MQFNLSRFVHALRTEGVMLQILKDKLVIWGLYIHTYKLDLDRLLKVRYENAFTNVLRTYLHKVNEKVQFCQLYFHPVPLPVLTAN